MNIRLQRAMVIVASMVILAATSTYLRADTGTCGGASITLPFTDVQPGNIFFCSIAEAFFSGLTNGTSPTTYNPSDPVPREQMAAFVTRTLDQSLQRGSRRAALKQFWTPTSADGLVETTVGVLPSSVESDGADLWVVNAASATISRVRASDGKLLETWTGASNSQMVFVARGRVYATGENNPGVLYQIDPTQPAGAVTVLSSSLGDSPRGIAFDGARIWTANFQGSVSIVTLNPVNVTTVSTGFLQPGGVLFDGTNIWVTDFSASKLFRLDSNGAIVQTVTMGSGPSWGMVFDGTNIWVPNIISASVTVVRASTGVVLATLSGNGLNQPVIAAFDGERILIANSAGHSVSLWKAADLSPLGSVSTGASTSPWGACSDGLNFWITLRAAGKLVRF